MRRALAAAVLIASLVPALPANATTTVYHPRIAITFANNVAVQGQIFHAPHRCVAGRTVTLNPPAAMTVTSDDNGLFFANGAFGAPGQTVTASITKLVFHRHGRRVCRAATTSAQVSM